MRHTPRLPRRRNAFTLIELLVVLVLILVIAAIGLGYIVFGQDNQHSVSGAQAITGAMLNAKQRARRDGLPTGVRILFGANGQASQLQLIQQPEDYNAGQCNPGANSSTVQFTGVDFQGGAATLPEADESTVEVGDYFLPASVPPTVHRITGISGPANNPTITLQSAVSPVVTANSPYNIIRAPRRLPSEDIIQLPPSVVIENGPILGGGTFCKNLPQNSTSGFAEIVFAPSGAVIGQGTGSDKVYLWLRDPSPRLQYVTGQQVPGAPLILSVQIRTGLIGVYPVAPWGYNTPFNVGNDPYAFVKDPRSSGL